VRAILALLNAGFQTAVSYRVRFMMSLASVLLTVVPVFFVAQALQGMMAPRIQGEGGDYFAFLILGFLVMALAYPAIDALPSQVGGDIKNGFFEALVGAPAGIPAVLVGLVAYPIAIALVRAGLMLATSVLLGVDVAWPYLPNALLIVVLLVAAHFGIGLIATAAVIAFRTTLSLPQLLSTGSALLGGVYWPTSVIPSWLQKLSDAFPVSYGLRALRRVALDGQGLAAVRDDLLTLTAFAGFLLSVGVLAMASALAQARRRGTLSQY
jgi:ABC-2 type transport system permease protein